MKKKETIFKEGDGPWYMGYVYDMGKMVRIVYALGKYDKGGEELSI
jgi:hypothetical protein